MHAGRVAAIVVAVSAATPAPALTVLSARPAHAAVEGHQVAGDTRVTVDPGGVASVAHEVRWRIVRGPFRWVDLTDIAAGAVVEPDVAVRADDGRTVLAYAAHAWRHDESTIRVALDDPRAVVRGALSFAVRWRVDLAAAGALARDGATWRLTWSTPAPLNGLDGARVIFDLPAAPEEPRPIVAETAAVDESAVATLERGAERDVLELVRPHVSGGQSVMWTVRLDPRALPLVRDPRLRPRADPPPPPARGPGAWLGVALAAVALSLGALVAYKGRAFARSCGARGVRARALIPLPDIVRPAVSGVALAMAVWFEWTGDVTLAGVGIALATLTAALRAPKAASRARGPGRWTALRAEDVFAVPPQPGHWLDISASAGRRTALAVGLAIAAVAVVLRRFDDEAAWLGVLDTAPLVALLVTGSAAQLPPDGVRSSARWLESVFRRLRAIASIRVAPWARVAQSGRVADELRLLVVPNIAMPGVVGLEVGLAWCSTPVCWAAAPEVLARVIEGSAADARLTREVPGVRSVPGRRPDERVLRLLPRAPTRSSTVALVRALVDMLADRRAAWPIEGPARPSTSPERRRATETPTAAAFSRPCSAGKWSSHAHADSISASPALAPR